MFKKVKDVIVRGDNRKILKLVKNETFDAVITSPPYNFNIQKKGFIPMEYDNVEFNDYLNMISEAFSESVRTLKPSGFFIYIVMNDIKRGRFLSGILNDILINKLNLVFKTEYVWCKKSIKMAKIEHIYILQKEPVLNTIYPYKVIDFINNYRRNQFSRIHPGYHTPQIYIELIKDFILNKGTILDPFAGTGSVGVAAKMCKNNYFLIEKNRFFYNLMRKRLKQKTLFNFFSPQSEKKRDYSIVMW